MRLIAAGICSLCEGEKRGLFVCEEACDRFAALAEQAGYVCCRTVSQPDPDHFRRRPVEYAETLKVFILCDDGEPVIARILPNRPIGTTHQASIADMGATRIKIRKLCDKPRCEIFVEEQHVPASRPGYSPLYARARRQTPDMLGCPRSSAAENRREPVARSCRKRGRRARRRR